ncbi:MAG: methyl-accepting chemotaxis protein [Clostridium sp.]
MKFFNERTIRKDMVLKFCTLMLITLLCINIAAIELAENALLSNSQELLKSFSLQVGKDINDLIDKEIEKVEIVASNPLIQDVNTSLKEKLDFLKIKVEDHKYKKAAIIDTNGVCTTILGEVVDVADKEYFKENMKGNSFYTEPYLSKADGGLQIAITVPVKKGNTVTSIVFFSMDAMELSEITNRITFGKTGSAYIVNEKGTNIANNDMQKVIDKVNRIEDGKTNSKFRELGAITERMITGENGIGNYEFDGDRKYLGFAPIESKGWSVGITTNEGDLLTGINKLRVTISILAGIAILLMIAATFKLSNDISKRLNKLKIEVEKIATGYFGNSDVLDNKGDEITDIYNALEKTKKSVGSIVEAINNSVDKLNKECFEIAEMADNIVTGTRTINKSIEESSIASESQATDLTNINLKLEKFDRMINENSDYINIISSKSKDINNMAIESQVGMNNLNDSIKSLSTSFNEFSKEISEMKGSMSTINDIITLINSISDQTNLLALNAAIEAARAGEAGRGFSVVADEIRSLAEQSKESTKSIYSIIENVLQSTDTIVRASEDINNEISRSEESVNESVGSFKLITASVTEIDPLIDSVTSSFEEIIKDKNDIIGSVEESAAASEEITAISEEILSSTNEFAVSIDSINSAIDILKDSCNEMTNEVNKFII